jgi:hypothetical protein
MSVETKAKMSATRKRMYAEGRGFNFWETEDGKKRAAEGRRKAQEERKKLFLPCVLDFCEELQTHGRGGWSSEPTSVFCKRHKAMDGRARAYGTDLLSVYQTYQDQEGRCKICSVELEFSGDEIARSIHMDHCHVRGVFRGVLCRRCNSTLGYVNEDVSVLRAMVDYLEKSVER